MMAPVPSDPVRRASAWFAASRLALMAAVLAVAWVTGLGAERHPLADGSWLLDRFAYWDSYHFIRIAEQGYLPPGLPCCDQAYFPGYPLVLAALRPVLGGSTVAAGILVSVAASVAAAALLWQLARDRLGTDSAARRAVLLFALAPCSVFLVAVYTESLFLALVLGAWLAGSRRRWWLAGALAALACGVRVNGLFVVVGLAVLYAGQLRTADGWRRPRADLLALGLPALTVGGYLAYLHHLTGSGDAGREAEAMGWHRVTTWPWVGLAEAVRSVAAAPDAGLAFSRSLDIAAVLAGIALVAALARRRRWAETAYLGLSVGVIACSTLWVSAPRSARAWFPGYLLRAELGERPRGRAAGAATVVASAVLLVLVTYAFATRQWVA